MPNANRYLIKPRSNDTSKYNHGAQLAVEVTRLLLNGQLDSNYFATISGILFETAQHGLRQPGSKILDPERSC